jgi:hypothetical protein
MKDLKKQGKRNRINGLLFEKKVKKELEEKGWIVSKWQCNIKGNFNYPSSCKHCSLKCITSICECKCHIKPKCVSSKPSKFRLMQTGFPDFIIYREKGCKKKCYEIIFVECKTNGYLSKEEKVKAIWYLNNNYCSKFLVAKKNKKGRKVIIEYKKIENDKKKVVFE